MTDVTVHVNARLSHQVEQADAWRAGLRRHGLDALVTPDRDAPGDVHILLGPNYAASYWRDHARTILLDRAFYGDPESVSLAWTCPPDGRRRFAWADGPRGAPLDLPAPPARRSAAMLCGDYVQDVRRYRLILERLAAEYPVVYFRPHPFAEPWIACPARSRPFGSIDDALVDVDVVVGFRTSAVVTAGLAGKYVEGYDPGSPAALWGSSPGDRRRWADTVQAHNWTIADIASGAAWDYLAAIKQEPAAVGPPC